jgi:hypothetical protein
MAWTESAIFRAWMADAVGQTTGFTGSWGAPGGPGAPAPLDGQFMVALFDGSITPDKTVARAASAYGGGQWLTTDPPQQADPNWPLVGVPLTGCTVVQANGPAPPAPATGLLTGLYTVFADQTENLNQGSGGVVTLDQIEGNLLYWAGPPANTVEPDQGAAFHWYGGPQSVTGGTFTVIWNAALGVMVVVV